MNRRRFILTSGSSVMVLVAGGVTYTLLGDAGEDYLKTMIKNNLDYLKLDDEGLNQFCSEFLSRKASYLPQKSGLLRLGHIINLTSLEFVEKRSHALTGELIRQYLLSSDFFFNGSDESKLVKFIKYYDPYEAGCFNPFAKLV